MLNINTVKEIISSVSLKIVINGNYGIGFSATGMLTGEEIMLKVFRRNFSNKYNLTMMQHGQLFEGIVSRNAYDIIRKIAEAHNSDIDRKVLSIKKEMDEADTVIRMARLNADSAQVARELKKLNLNFLRSEVTKYTSEIGEYEVSRFLETCSYAEGMLHMANK